MTLDVILFQCSTFNTQLSDQHTMMASWGTPLDFTIPIDVPGSILKVIQMLTLVRGDVLYYEQRAAGLGSIPFQFRSKDSKIPILFNALN